MATSTGQKIEGFAEDLGKLLGTATAKAEGWLNQRQQIAKTLEGIRDTAINLLGQLGRGASAGFSKARSAASGRAPGRPLGKRGSGRSKGSGRKRRKMSAAARKAISDAQKKRWGKVKAAQKK